MDSYRGNLVRHEPTYAEPHGIEDGPGQPAAGEDDIGQEPPPASVGQDDRRMQVRAYNYWASLLGQRQFPQIAELARAAMPDFADHAVVLDFSDGVADPAVAMLGDRLAEECGVTSSVTRLSEVPAGSLLSRVSNHCLQMLGSAAPIGFEAEFVNQRGRTLLYRGILLPFSSDGDEVRHLMGVINWKELADPIMTAGLRHELDIASIAGPTPLPGEQLNAWADGPLAADNFQPELADWLAEMLRKLPVRAMPEIDREGSEFAGVLIRRLPGGGLCWLGEVSRDAGLIERMAEHLLQ